MLHTIATVLVWLMVIAGVLGAVAAIALAWDRQERRWTNRRR